MYLGAYSIAQYVGYAGEAFGALAQILISTLRWAALGIWEARGLRGGAEVAGKLQEVQGAVLLRDEGAPQLPNLPASHLRVDQEPGRDREAGVI